MSLPDRLPASSAVRRVRIWYGLLLIIVAIFGVRLFYLQIIRYDHYHHVALQQQFKDYGIPAKRGIIEAYDGNKIVPLVLNQKLYTLYADPKFIKDPHMVAAFVKGIIGGDASTYEQEMRQPNRYDILAKKLTEAQKNKLMAPKTPGLNVETHIYRSYPDGGLAAQLLGFVNDDGTGVYGVEQALNSKLAGKPGLLKAITDIRGVPLPANSDNVRIAPTPGQDVVLTIDMSVQQQVENILDAAVKQTKSKSGSVVIMNPNTGAIVAMANYPSYNPGDYAKVKDPSLYANAAVSSQLEVGSIMKILTVAAGLDKGVITPDSTYYDPGTVTVDGWTIPNVLPLPNNTPSIKDVLRMSLNTGAVHVLKTLGGGELNANTRNIWHDYLVNHYQFSKPTGIAQTGEASGSVASPADSPGINLQYAESAFGQGISVTLLQMTAAASSVLNGGTYYQPHLVAGYMDDTGNLQPKAPTVVRRDVISPKASEQTQGLMKYVFDNNYLLYRSHLHDGYTIGGKTGTAQIPKNGGYLDNVNNGSFLGFVGGDQPQYVVTVFLNRPNLPPGEYAGTEGTAPIFGSIADMLINSGKVTPKTH